MDKVDYSERFGAPLPCSKRPEIYGKSIADSATGVIRAKDKAIYWAHITDWDTYEAAESES